jgi:hypothetical protein
MTTGTAFFPQPSQGTVTSRPPSVGIPATIRMFLRAVPHHEWVVFVVLAGLVLLGLMEFIDWWVGHLVTFCEHMHTHWIHLRSIGIPPDFPP